VLRKARSEVDDLQARSVHVHHLGAQDRRVALVGLRDRSVVLQFDVEAPLFAIIVEQRTRVAVERGTHIQTMLAVSIRRRRANCR
jgi:hypothetical protein